MNTVKKFKDNNQACDEDLLTLHTMSDVIISQSVHEQDYDSTYDQIVDAIINNESSILLHSPGGTGKSFMLRRLITDLRINYGKIVYATTPTGISAVNLSDEKVSASTIHRWAGIG